MRKAISQKQKVLLMIPPQIVNNNTGVDQRANVSIPLGILYVAASIRKEGLPWDLKVYDSRLGAKRYTDAENFEMFGDTWETVEKEIRDYQPDVVGISNMFSVQISAAIKVAEICKKINHELITVIGGPHASSFPEKMISKPSIDYVVMGEGEERFCQLLRDIKEGRIPQIQGVLKTKEDLSLLRSSKKAPITFIKKLDDVPLPAYDLVDVERYFSLQKKGFASRIAETGNRSVSIITSRGCPHQCIFCSVQVTMGYKWRQHSPEYVENYINFLRNNYDIDYIHFEDDNFTFDIKRYDKILDNLISQDKIIKWGTPNSVRADSWSYDLIKKTKQSGAQYLSIAIESSSQRVIDEVIKKRLDLTKVEPVMKACHEVNLPLFAGYVLGLPGETKEEIKGTVDWAIDKYKRYGVNPGFNLAIPLPGTEFYDIVMKENLLQGFAMHDPPRRNSIKTEEFDPEFLREIFANAQKRRHRITLRRMIQNPKILKYYILQAIRYIPRSFQILKEIFLPQYQVFR